MNSGSHFATTSTALPQPLWKLLAINLASGVAAAVLLVGGLLVANPGHLRELIAADIHSVAAIALLLFGFVVTFGSTAMGTAIMAIGRAEANRSR